MRKPASNRPALPATRLLRRPRVLLVGCGDIGLRIVARLAGRARVTGVVATEQGAARVRAAGARAIVANLDLARRRRRPLPSAPWMIHLAPTSPAGNRDLRLEQVLRETAPAGRMVYVSTTGVYGDRGGAWVDETSAPRPRNPRAVRRLQAELAARRSRRHASVLRAPGIYAADRLPLARLRDRVPALLPADDIFTNHIHAEDLARACLLALLRGRPARVYNVVDSTELRLGDYLDRVADAFGMERAPRVAAGDIETLVDAARRSFLSESRRIRNTRLTGELGLRLRFADIDAGIRDALAQAGKRLSTER